MILGSYEIQQTAVDRRKRFFSAMSCRKFYPMIISSITLQNITNSNSLGPGIAFPRYVDQLLGSDAEGFLPSELTIWEGIYGQKLTTTVECVPVSSRAVKKKKKGKKQLPFLKPGVDVLRIVRTTTRYRCTYLYTI